MASEKIAKQPPGIMDRFRAYKARRSAAYAAAGRKSGGGHLSPERRIEIGRMGGAATAERWKDEDFRDEMQRRRSQAPYQGEHNGK